MEKYQTIGHRIGASFIDGLVMIPVTFVFTVIGGIAGNGILMNLIPPVFSVLYVVLMHTFHGQTLGKMALKIKVVDDQERPIIFGQAVLRSLPQFAYLLFILTFVSSSKFGPESNTGTFYIFFWIVYVLFYVFDIGLFLINDKHRSLHDFLAKTVVIRTNV